MLFLEHTQPMYNLTVAEAHAFFVGDGQWLVHNTEKICLKPYKDGGGHHVHSKKAFEDLPKKTYDPALAPSVPKSALKSGQHAKMTGIQQKLFRQLSKDVSKGIKKNTLKEHSRIAYETLVQAGFDPKVAKRLVRESETWLRKRGAKPTKIPWGS